MINMVVGVSGAERGVLILAGTRSLLVVKLVEDIRYLTL